MAGNEARRPGQGPERRPPTKKPTRTGGSSIDTTSGKSQLVHPADDVQRLMALFPGYSKARGRWTPGAVEGDKHKGRSVTLHATTTPETWRQHLAGHDSLGVILILDDGQSVQFGAIDYDKRPCDHAQLEQRVKALGLPLIVCRSKSGGAHLYCFTTEPVPAKVMCAALARWRALLGFGESVEIFPKQTSRIPGRSDVGSFINMPYFDVAHTTRPAWIDGRHASLPAFLDAAEAARVRPEALAEAPTLAPHLGDRFLEAPPCLQCAAAAGGFAEGTRNNGMTAVAVYLRKRFPDTWKDHVDKYNEVMARLPSDEVQQIIKSHHKKPYSYQCDLSPMREHCDRHTCTGRQFGIGAHGDDITGVTRYKAGKVSSYALEIGDYRLWVDSATLANRDAFNRKCMNEIGRYPIHLSPAQWGKRVDELLQKAEVVEDPEDASPEGQLWEWIERFLTSQTHALTRDELFLGKVFRHNDGRTYFRSSDLVKYLNDRHQRSSDPHALWALLREHGGDTTSWKIRDKALRLWSVPTPVMPTEEEPEAVSEERETF